jgi:hypothetical protein
MKMTAIQQLEYQDYLAGCSALNETPSLKDFLDGEINDGVVDFMTDIENERREALAASA